MTHEVLSNSLNLVPFDRYDMVDRYGLCMLLMFQSPVVLLNCFCYYSWKTLRGSDAFLALVWTARGASCSVETTKKFAFLNAPNFSRIFFYVNVGHVLKTHVHMLNLPQSRRCLSQQILKPEVFTWSFMIFPQSPGHHKAWTNIRFVPGFVKVFKAF